MKGRNVIRHMFGSEKDDEKLVSDESVIDFYVDEELYTTVPKPLLARKHISDGVINYSKGKHISTRTKRVFDLIPDNTVFEEGWLIRLPCALRYDETEEKIRSNLDMFNIVRDNEHSNVVEMNTQIYVSLPEDYDMLLVNPSGITGNGVSVVPMYIDNEVGLMELKLQLMVNENDAKNLNQNIIHNEEPVAKLLPINRSLLNCNAQISVHSE